MSLIVNVNPLVQRFSSSSEVFSFGLEGYVNLECIALVQIFMAYIFPQSHIANSLLTVGKINLHDLF